MPSLAKGLSDSWKFSLRATEHQSRKKRIERFWNEIFTKAQSKND